jgi:hypothetical protein
MKHVIKVVFTGPEGGIEKIFYALADGESDLERTMQTDFGGFVSVSCLGPIIPFPEWMEKRIKLLESKGGAR